MQKDSDSPIKLHGKKKYITNAEAKEYVHKMDLKPPLSDYKLSAMFYESIVCIVDTLRTNRYLEMQLWEWIVFICRVTHEYYSRTKYKNEKMVIKLEKMLPKWFAVV